MIKADISFTSGNSKTLKFNVKDKTGVPVDITGASGKFYIAFPDDVTFQKDIVVDAGLVKVDLIPDDTINYCGVFKFEVELTLADGFIATVKEGWIELKENLAN